KYFEARTFLEKKTTTKFRLTGIMKADVVQTCVLSLKPVKKVIDEEIDITLIPAGEFEEYMKRTADEGILELSLDTNVPDTYDHEVIQLGSFVLEYFALGLDPYPRAENAEIDQSAVKSDRKASAFASLAALKDKMK
ncbi:MAG: YceD family protein, partial [Hyphomicrobiales bacterium]